MAATASIRIDQPTHPTTPTGQPGRARDDLVLGQPVILRSAEDSDVVRWVWSLLDRPLGSAAALSGTTSPTVTFVPDVEGSYRIRLAVNDAIEGQITTRVAAVRSNLGHRLPAVNETTAEVNWPGNDANGWGKDVEAILRRMNPPQLLASTASETIPAAVASTVVGFGGIGLPSSLAQIADYGWVDLMGALGTEPTVNGWTFLSLPGSGGKAIDFIAVDLDSTGCVASDKWALVIGHVTSGNLLALQIEIV